MRNACQHRNKYKPLLENYDVGWVEWCRDCGALRTVCHHVRSAVDRDYDSNVKVTTKRSKWKVPTKVF